MDRISRLGQPYTGFPMLWRNRPGLVAGQALRAEISDEWMSQRGLLSLADTRTAG